MNDVRLGISDGLPELAVSRPGAMHACLSEKAFAHSETLAAAAVSRRVSEGGL